MNYRIPPHPVRYHTSKRDLALFGMTPSKRDLAREPHRGRIGDRGRVSACWGPRGKRFNTFSQEKMKKIDKKVGRKEVTGQKSISPQ